jgi:uncharacterized protein YyaL (SSP411 family)
VGATNRLSQETSPYLLQHAENPVAWWPWGDEAFAEARRRDVPVLISIGYSACHWCHVMAHESFEDEEVAAVLNAHFVPVKVDREERPDVDAVYMEAVQLVTGTGGWPMTVVATPDGCPFWAGTYLPKPTFLRVLSQVAELWSGQRQTIEEDAARLAQAVQEGSALPKPVVEEEDSPVIPVLAPATAGWTGPAGSLARCASALLARQDPEWGGSEGAPKFPQPTSLEALAQYWWRSGDTRALEALRRTLDAMSSGGIYDHLGGGFSRYSTDRYWLVPHFEKMLYDNALLARAYTHAWQLTGSPRYRQVVHETVGYLLAGPLRLAEGAWASAEDADSEGEEGRFYTWSYDELVSVGGEEAASWYGASPKGNWEGGNILWRPGLGDIARPAHMEQARLALFEHRERRPRPGLDGKVLTEWNGMAIAVLCAAGTAFDQPAWVAAASGAAEVMLDVLRRPDGRWLRSWRPGSEAKHLACAGDYAWLVEAFTRLGEATGRCRWTSVAEEAATSLLELFWDEKEGGFFTSGSDAPPLVARMKDVFDGALPSANAAAAHALARLGELTGQERFLNAATQVVEAMGPALQRAPGAFAGTAAAADFMASGRRQVVVTSSTTDLVEAVWSRYLPDTVLAWGEPYPSALWEGRLGSEAAGQAFVCHGFTCKLPVTTAAELAGLLSS